MPLKLTTVTISALASVAFCSANHPIGSKQSSEIPSNIFEDSLMLLLSMRLHQATACVMSTPREVVKHRIRGFPFPWGRKLFRADIFNPEARLDK